MSYRQSTHNNHPSVSITIEDVSPGRKAVKLTIPSATIAGYEGEAVREITSGVSLPGFRKGHAPGHVVRRQFASAINTEVKQRVVKNAFEQVKTGGNLSVYEVISLDGLDDIPPGGDLSLHIVVDVKPEFELPEYKGLELPPRAEATVSDDDITAAVERLRAHHARYEVVDRPAEKGDFVKLSYTGTIGGTPVKDIAPEAHLYGTQPATWEEAGAEGDGRHIPEIVSGIIGKKAGDKAEFSHAFPEDFPAEALRGRTAGYTVEIFEVRARILPEMNEDFFKQVEAKDIDELRSQLRERVLAGKEEEISAKQRTDAVEKLISLVDFPLPDSAVDTQLHDLFVQYATSRIRSNIPLEDVKSEEEAFREESRPTAAKKVKLHFILQKIASLENLTATAEEMMGILEREAWYSGQPPEKFIKTAVRDSARLKRIRTSIVDSKALDIVIQNAKA